MTAEHYDVFDSSDNRIVWGLSFAELLALIRLLRRLNATGTEREVWVVAYDEAGEPTRLRPSEVLRER